ncbi:MAG: KilA-N domain-containing protein [Prolixibacteraceae bacterium]|jgi:hypothetical protein|nr:KilA-N domain-containing protein [Prolixibacteraceae bacterium]
MAKERKIQVKETSITVLTNNQTDFISLTDMTAGFIEGSGLIGKWVTNKNTIEYIGIWEKINNQDFNYTEFGVIENEAGVNRFIMSVGQWIERTKAKGNYHIHTDAIKEKLIPKELNLNQINFVYANEADMLNMALFGTTAKQWRDANPNMEGNIRDEASIEQLVVLSNMESINAVLIHQGLPQCERLTQLNKIAITQMKSLLQNCNLKKLK